MGAPEDGVMVRRPQRSQPPLEPPDNSKDQGETLVDKLKSIVVSNAFLGVGVVVASLGAVLYSGFAEFASGKVKGYIVNAVRSDLKSEQSLLVPDIIAYLQANTGEGDKFIQALDSKVTSILNRQISSHVGALDIGQFRLSRLNPERIIQIYSPPNHRTYLLIKADGLRNGQSVMLVAPTGQRQTLVKQGIFSFNVHDELFKGPVTDQSALISEITEEDADESTIAKADEGYFDDIYSITFKFAKRRSFPDLQDADYVDIAYMTVVSPVITMELSK